MTACLTLGEESFERQQDVSQLTEPDTDGGIRRSIDSKAEGVPSGEQTDR